MTFYIENETEEEESLKEELKKLRQKKLQKRSAGRFWRKRAVPMRWKSA